LGAKYKDMDKWYLQEQKLQTFFMKIADTCIKPKLDGLYPYEARCFYFVYIVRNFEKYNPWLFTNGINHG